MRKKSFERNAMLAKIFYVFQPSKIKIAKKKNPKQAAWFSLNAKTEEKKPSNSDYRGLLCLNIFLLFFSSSNVLRFFFSPPASLFFLRSHIINFDLLSSTQDFFFSFKAPCKKNTKKLLAPSITTTTTWMTMTKCS